MLCVTVLACRRLDTCFGRGVPSGEAERWWLPQLLSTDCEHRTNRHDARTLLLARSRIESVGTRVLSQRNSLLRKSSIYLASRTTRHRKQKRTKMNVRGGGSGAHEEPEPNNVKDRLRPGGTCKGHATMICAPLSLRLLVRHRILTCPAAPPPSEDGRPSEEDV